MPLVAQAGYTYTVPARSDFNRSICLPPICVGTQDTVYGYGFERTRVRITAPLLSETVLLGTLRLMHGDSLLLTTSEGTARMRLPLRDVETIELSRGRDRIRYAGLGAVAGGLGMALAFGSSVEEQTGGEPIALGVGFLTGLLVGAPLGAVLGAAYAPERWTTSFDRRFAGIAPPGTTTYRLEIDPGTELRAFTRAAPAVELRGRAGVLQNDTLSLITNAPRARFALDELARLEVRGGKDRSYGMLRGAIVLTAITTVGGGIDLARGRISTGELAGTLVGNIFFGAAVGYFFPRRGWEAVGLPRSGNHVIPQQPDPAPPIPRDSTRACRSSWC